MRLAASILMLVCIQLQSTRVLHTPKPVLPPPAAVQTETKTPVWLLHTRWTLTAVRFYHIGIDEMDLRTLTKLWQVLDELPGNLPNTDSKDYHVGENSHDSGYWQCNITGNRSILGCQMRSSKEPRKRDFPCTLSDKARSTFDL